MIAPLKVYHFLKSLRAPIIRGALKLLPEKNSSFETKSSYILTLLSYNKI